MRTIGIVSVSLVLVLAGPLSASAQIPISLGVRSGQSKAVAGGRSWDGGWSFDLVAAYRISPAITAYLMGGGADVGEHRDDDTIDLSVYSTTLGMTMLMGPLAVGRPAPWLGASVGLYSLAATRSLGSLDEMSKTRFGVDLAAGIAVAVSPRVHVTPAIRVATFASDFTFQDSEVAPVQTRRVGNVAYVMLDVGVMYNFGVRPRR